VAWGVWINFGTMGDFRSWQTLPPELTEASDRRTRNCRVFGEQTENAARRFQQARKIPVDGVGGRETWINIDEADQSHPVLTLGSTGLPVRRLQSRISALGFYVGGVDSRFGPRTEAAVRKLQQDRTST
jgi:peptidoglycan hydrolase-like protein with peptidoglycan-binding domain